MARKKIDPPPRAREPKLQTKPNSKSKPRPTPARQSAPRTQEEPVIPGVNPAAAEHDVPRDSLPFPIVAIGASAGGLPAFTDLIRALPADTGMAYVVITHLSPTHESMISAIIGRATRMTALEVTDDMPVEPDRVYVIPPNAKMTLSNGVLKLGPRTQIRGEARPIDHFMRSLAEEQGYKAIGVVLSGTGTDGTLGTEEIKAAGGITFAQDSATAEQAAMPRSAIASGTIDFVMTPREIAEELARLARHPYVAPTDIDPTVLAEPAFRRVLDVLRKHTGVDFSNYKRNTLHRRITRRMVLRKLTSVREYLAFLQARADEVEALFQDVLINVTSFFRNPEAYEALKTQVFPKLTEKRDHHDPLRIWALGCSTGEEAYSIAMAFLEYAETSGRRVPLQIFATDLNGAGIDKARNGVYTKGIVQDVSAERLRRFFVEIDGTYRVTRQVREMCVFARQNVITDPPFSRLDMVACRNLLIYLDPVLQQRLIPLLHYSLREDGFLWLGGAESIGTYRDLFNVLDAKNKIYVRKPGVRAAPPLMSKTRGLVPAGLASRPANRAPDAPAGVDPAREADRLLLSRYAPASVLVNDDLEIVQFRGDTGPFLTPAPGRASLNIVKMLREGLAVGVRGALSRARRDNTPVREKGLRVRSNGEWRDVDVLINPLKGGEGPAAGYLVVFEEPASQLEDRARAMDEARVAAERAAPTDPSGKKEIDRLQRELSATREYLQSVIEQQEAANEELQGANEEVQSANEELQSINEELETSKEEIQSANEELSTVNDELQHRNNELSLSNNDLVNLLSSVQIAIVMLGRDLRIRRYTPVAEKLLKLIPSDVGRTITDVKLGVDIPDLEARIVEAMETVSVRELEVRDAAGKWVSLRVHPYRTVENAIEGAVVVLLDVDTLKGTERSMHDTDERKNEFIAVLGHELRNPLAAARNAVRLIGTTGEPQVVEEARRILERQTSHMARLIDDLLDLARVNYGKVNLRVEPVDVVAALRSVVQATSTERETKQHVFEAQLPEGPLWVSGDSLRLEQVFANLLSNATKFTPKRGRIWLATSIEGPDAHGAQVVVRVRDNGIGLPEDVLPRIFEHFVQAGGESGLARAGLGLGLTVARQLVTMHGGTIEASSQGRGKGSEFVVRLPLLSIGVKEQQQEHFGALKAAGPRRLLIVDDNVDSAESMRIMFSIAGHEVRSVATGGEALAAAASLRPDAVLLDIGLPDIDGYEVARRLRAEPLTRDALIVAMTGYGREEDMRRSIKAGIDHHEVKPVDLDKVLAWIVRGRARR